MSSSSSSSSSEALHVTNEDARRERGTEQIKWTRSVQDSSQKSKGGVAGSVDDRVVHGGGLGRTSVHTEDKKIRLSPLAPLEKPATEDVQFRRQKKLPVGTAFSSPNLKALNTPLSPEQARLMEYYLSGAAPRNNSNYVDPLYRHLNPSVGSAKSRPVWSLSQPLPHVLDQSLAEKMIKKNIDAKSRTSSRPESREMSRAGSFASVNDWKKLIGRSGSRRKLNDVEAQILGASKKKGQKQHRKHSQTQIEFANDQSRAHHGASFSLGDESCASSMRGEEVPTQTQSQTQVGTAPTGEDLLEKNFGPGREGATSLDGGCPGTGDTDSEQLAFTNYWAKVRYRLREPFAEFLGTLILVIFGVGGNLQATVTNGSGGSFESLSFAWGFGCMLGVYVAGGVSGGHINPAVTISMAIFRKFPWKKVPIYIFAQIVGAFFGGAMAYGYYWSSITEFEGGPHIRTAASGACLFTNPKSYVTWRNAFFDEFIGAAMLVGCLMALLDDSNAPPTNGMTALIVGFLVAAIGMALGYQTSFTINPARDLGPRIFASMIGYGPHAFHLTHWWWTWGAWGGPIAGGIAGALVYDIFIFTGCESPVNYPDNGYIEHRVSKILHSEFDPQNSPKSSEIVVDEGSNSKEDSTKSNTVQ
ncbi:LAQU0S17e02542g1_1 [Lachancea quebecensis]|uniref:LAQU0S17e02542g1_1 n=1 Tax=Lachancea quebecensis TaxID=1654605 RepID=A0A0P1KX19_9SACH|nr:LAQU0S17e02542g1_1 [Lachancea quebecensis]